MGRPQLGFPRLRFVAVTANDIAMALIILRRGGRLFCFARHPVQSLECTYQRVAREARMPRYEFFCLDCKAFFDKILSLVDYEEGDCRLPALRKQEGRGLRHHVEKDRMKCAAARPDGIVRFVQLHY